MLRKIKLLGKLGQRFGREFEMYINNPAEAIKALSCQLAGFQKFLYDSSEQGIGYRVVVESPEGRSEEELCYPMGGYGTIVIAPIASGSGGFGRILLGAVLIGAAFAFPAGILGISATTIGLMGASMVLGGFAQMLATKPKTPKKDSEKQDSYLFSRGAESGKQGKPVPLAIGEMIFPLEIVLSSGISTNEIPA